MEVMSGTASAGMRGRCAWNLYKRALCGPLMVDGTESGKSEYLERLDAEARAKLTPEDWERAARLNSMSLEDLRKIGRKEYEEPGGRQALMRFPSAGHPLAALGFLCFFFCVYV